MKDTEETKECQYGRHCFSADLIEDSPHKNCWKTGCCKCGKLQEISNTKPESPSDKTWEERFDKHFQGVIDEELLYTNTISMKAFIQSELTSATIKAKEITEDTSDGYHTFKELYEFRKVYNVVLFNEWYRQGKYAVHKSLKHHDGEDCFGGGWFIVMATLPTGQISNHYEIKDWHLFKCTVKERADLWDGHTAQDVVKRLLNLEEPSK